MIAALHTYWVFPHFKFLQLGDPVSGNKSGYQALLMTKQYFLMHGDLVACMDNKWKQQAEFENIVSLMNTMSDEQKVKVERKMMHSISIMIDYLEKNVKIVRTYHLHSFPRQRRLRSLPRLFSASSRCQLLQRLLHLRLCLQQGPRCSISLQRPQLQSRPPLLPICTSQICKMEEK